MKAMAVALLAIAALLAGCASSNSKPYVHNPKLSEALNLAEAAGIYGLEDIPADQAYRAGGSGTGIAGAVVVGALDAGSPLPGFSALGGGLMGFLSMAIPPSKGIAGSSQIVAFVPKRIAPDVDLAAKAMFDELMAAVTAAREAIDLPQPFRYGEIEVRQPENNHGVLSISLPVHGGYCDDASLTCRFYSGAPTGGGASTAGSRSRIREGFAPQSWGGADSWRFVSGTGLSNGDGRGGFWESPLLPEFQFYQKVSERLPPWMYLYSAPGHTSYRRENGTYAWLPAPVILRQGGILPFIEPGGAQAAPGQQTGFTDQ